MKRVEKYTGGTAVAAKAAPDKRAELNPLDHGNWQDPDRKHVKVALQNNIGADVAINARMLPG
jgi:hypothetical protein